MKKKQPIISSSFFFFVSPTMPRRRHRFPSISSAALAAVVLLLLVLISLLSLFTPPFIDHRRNPRNLIEFSESESKPIFQVPREGGTSKYGLWSSKFAGNFIGCSNASKKFEAETKSTPNRILAIATSGGLNQQRTGVIDAVVAARILNATLIVPKLDEKSFWKDSSKFSEIFDVDMFITSLSKDVQILKDLPRKGGKIIRAPYNMRVPRKCTPRCYQKRVLPVLLKKHVVQLSKFDYRLANRFEPDMLAFSGCYYGGGEKERRELGAIRKRWKTLHTSNPEKERRHGKCPLTPEEVGLMLRALGYGNDVHIYVASGEVYGGEDTLAPLKALFPNFHSKETLASKGELEPFSLFASRMAALDFIVCDGSDAFVTNNNGNMAKILAGRRRYFGHKRTIRPNAKKLYSLFLNHSNLTWEVFASKVCTYQRGYMGEPNEVRPGRGEFHENPSTCICENSEAKKHDSMPNQLKVNTKGRKESLSKSDGEPTNNHVTEEDYHDADDEPEVPDFDEDENPLQTKSAYNGTKLDYDLFDRAEYLELEEMFSD